MLNKLCLLWQDVNTRSWFHIGNLTLDPDGVYSFFYETDSINKGLEEALENGYRLHPTFPDVDKTYLSESLFSAFSRRLPDRKRKDYVSVLSDLGINGTSTDFDLLSLTGGAVNSDLYEFVQPIQFDDTNHQFKLDFFVRGWRYHGEKEKLSQSDQLVLEVEENNEFDQDAVYILKNNKNKIGYVPAFYSSFIKSILMEKLNYDLTFQFNEDSPSHYKVKVFIKGLANEKILSDYHEKVLLNC
ncbi:HIRAN domain-containing protein [Carnobacterium iners]|uniref:HIRAN domain-containing protein n=1 Tax=Carnobacterium iners TaxID=1073423 RepID=A0A1X7MRP3_9LACT|nr:HIRAN domain-containing protein [Carnobacterium iners]SEK94815.1 HIRAN domain-containing protein [Carnobacterium iners]SMH26633.1 HIRAN domain-containing protein [Carnobacterium iners]